jgi:hypothetical protein
MIGWLCWFVLLTVAARILFPPPRRVEPPQLPTTVAEFLASPMPLAYEVDRCTKDEGSGGTILNTAAALLHMKGEW